MKPTNQCKKNFIFTHYFDSRIASLYDVEIKFNIKLDKNERSLYTLPEYFNKISLRDNYEEIINFMLAKIPEWSCAGCVNQYTCKLKEITNETYEPM
jgi:hypothetical protein